MVSVSSIYSVLGNPNSLVPLAVKDIANSCGLTAASYLTGNSAEGQDRFIDEFGTQAIWLWGIPAYKKVLDLGIKYIAKYDPNVDVRILKDEKIANLAKEFAPNEKIAKSIQKSIEHKTTNKTLTIAKFVISTLMTSLTYLSLTKFRHKYTEEKIKKEYYERQKKEQEKLQSQKDLTFGNKVTDFMFDPVKNMMILDATITGERLTHARNTQDLMGYTIKEGSFWLFMYFANDIIRKALEKSADKKGKSIDLDARVLENEEFKTAFKDGKIQKAIEEFENIEKATPGAKDDAALYKYLVTNEDNLIVKVAKTSDQIKVYGGEKPWYKRIGDTFKLDNDTKNLKTGKVDTREYIDLDSIRDLKDKVKKLYGQSSNAKEGLEEFFNAVKKSKRASVWVNMGACIGALGVLAPGIMLLSRRSGNNTEYQVKKDIEERLKREALDTQA